MRLEISEDAERDLRNIYRQGVTAFGLGQADDYIDSLLAAMDLIADFPKIARLRMDYNPPTRIYLHGSHAIVYDLDEAEGRVVVVRIRHGHEDWQGLSSEES
jgi:toxin ParE1/3/4